MAVTAAERCTTPAGTIPREAPGRPGRSVRPAMTVAGRPVTAPAGLRVAPAALQDALRMVPRP